MHKAKYWETAGNGISCNLCPHHCHIANDRTGRCRVRQNKNGELLSLNYGEIASIALDPIEKKPLFHFYPGKMILSAGTWGCNFHCSFCQNWELAHGNPTAVYTNPERLAELAVQQGPKNIGIAYTYSEPVVWFEYVVDTAIAVKRRGLKNVLVTNGFISPEPLEELLPLIDAMNIDVKAFRAPFYQEVCKGELEAVKRTVETAARSCHVEVTTLVIPGLNDGEDEILDLARWIASISPKIPLHFSRYFPRYQMEQPSTPSETLFQIRDLARQELENVYLGNIG